MNAGKLLALCAVLVSNLVSFSAAANEQTLRAYSPVAPKAVDPVYVSTIGEQALGAQLFEGIYTIDANGDTVFGQAESVDVTKDGTRYIYTLRPDIKWSNGDPVTAQDFVLTFRRMMDPSVDAFSKSSYLLANVQNAKEIGDGAANFETLGVSAPDARTLVIDLVTPTPYMPHVLSYVSMSPTPSMVYEKVGERWTDPENIVANGAYMLESLERADSGLISKSTLLKNPQYYQAGTVYFDKVIQRYDTERDQVALFADGELDLLLDYYGHRMEWAIDTLGASVVRGDRIYTVYVALNQTDPAMQDARVRRALALALDVDAVTPRIDPLSSPAQTFSTPIRRINWVPPRRDYADQPMEVRLTEARGLLSEAGYSTEKPLSVTLSSVDSAAGRRVAAALAEAWETLGVNVELSILPSGEHYRKLAEGTFQVGRASWAQDVPDPSDYLNLLRTGHIKNYARWSNAEYDALLDELRLETRLERRQELFVSLESIIAEQAPIIPIYHGAYATLVRKGLDGVVLNPNVALFRYLRMKAD